MKDAENIRASDSEDEVVRDKPPGQKRARRLEKEIVSITAAVAAKEVVISQDIAKFQDKARNHRMSLEVEVDNVWSKRNRTLMS